MSLFVKNMSQQRTWEVFWEIPNCPPAIGCEPTRFFVEGMKAFTGNNFQNLILDYRNNTKIEYFDASEWSVLDKILFEKILKDVRWGEKMNDLPRKYCTRCFYYLDTTKAVPIEKKSDIELYRYYKQFHRIYILSHSAGHPANMLEMKNQRLSQYLITYLQRRIWTTDHEITSANELFSLLTAQTKDMSPQQEAKSFFRVTQAILEYPQVIKQLKTKQTTHALAFIQGKYPGLYKKMRTHETAWCWTGYNWEGPPNDMEYYIATWASTIKQDMDIQIEMEKLQTQHAVTRAEQQAAIKALGIDQKHKKLLKTASDIMFLKSLRKDCMYKASWVSEPMYTEIGKRLGLSTHEARYIFVSEMEDALIRRQYSPAVIKSRTQEVVIHMRSGKPDIVLHGKAARILIASLNVKQPDKNIPEIKGQCAYPGKVRGRVRYVNTPEMMNKMEQGDILVAYATQPNIIPAMKKASAFVTDFGGLTCHAAIVAREWKVPCVIGTGNATKILQDGELVEVDAESGTITRLEK